MRYASSIRYGGQLVEAIECDYEDYKYLGLLCPECKEPVFLRGEGKRVQNGKEVSIGAHFCHFKTKDPVLAVRCEQRVSQYTEKDLERRAVQARGQRLKLLQGYFWNVIDRHYREAGDPIESSSSTQIVKSLIQKASDSFADLVLDSGFQASINSLFENMISTDGTTFYLDECTRSIPAVVNRKMIQRFKSLKSIDLKLQKSIFLEIAEFLASPSSRELLERLIQHEMDGVIYALEVKALNPDGLKFKVKKVLGGSVFATNSRGWLRVSLTAIMGLWVVVATIPWADEFAKLQKTPIAAAS